MSRGQPGLLITLLIAWTLLLAPVSSALAEEEALPPPAKSTTLSQALQRALQRNPSALTAQQEIERADALVREVRAPSMPSISASVTGTRLDAQRSQAGRVLQPIQALSASATVTLPLVAPPRWAQWSHARDQAGISHLNAADVQRTLSIAVGHTYLAVIGQHRQVEVSDRAFRTAQNHYQFAHGRRVGGVGNRLDEVRAQQEVESTLAQLKVTQGALYRAQEALGVLLAEDGPVDAAAEDSLAEPPALGSALGDASSRRADVQVAQSKVEATSHVVRDSYTDYLPFLSAQFSPFTQNPATATLPVNGWTAQLIFTIPIYDGGFRTGARQERQALESEARIALDGSLRQVQSEVRASYDTLQRMDQALAAARRSAVLAQEAFSLADQAYRAGATANLDVIDAERRARDAETTAAIAEDSARQARLDLLAASGRFP